MRLLLGNFLLRHAMSLVFLLEIYSMKFANYMCCYFKTAALTESDKLRNNIQKPPVFWSKAR